MTDWIANLKPHDRIIVEYSHGISLRTKQRVDSVAIVTKTQIITHGGSRYRRNDGECVPSVLYAFNRISEPYTEKRGAEIKEQRRREWLVRRIAAVTEEKLLERSTEQLEQIYELIKGEGE
ncbi:MAG: hypothetical protein KDK05_28975 [Candidatus Competibacteraceae bacterium]|nr:hypothetical protein [Candidatus Competibacteraceae bacterium]